MIDPELACLQQEYQKYMTLEEKEALRKTIAALRKKHGEPEPMVKAGIQDAEWESRGIKVNDRKA